MTFLRLDDQIGLRARSDHFKFQLLGKLEKGLPREAQQLSEKGVAFVFRNRQGTLRAQQRNPAKDAMIVEASDPIVPEYQSAREEQDWFRQLHLRLTAPQSTLDDIIAS